MILLTGHVECGPSLLESKIVNTETDTERVEGEVEGGEVSHFISEISIGPMIQ
jgi:hypothetical protein